MKSAMEKQKTQNSVSTKKLKIAILTFWWSNDNYGQQLQAYALQKYLRDMGHDAFLIRYACNDYITKSPLYVKILKAMNPVKLAVFVISKVKANHKKSLLEKERLENPRHFEDFREKHIAFDATEYTSYSELKQNPPDADIYIVGSDQVWNFFNYKAKNASNVIHSYFLDFGKPETKRISYAASWGKSVIPDDQRDEIEPLIKKFDFITVREKSGVDVCKSFGVNSEWVCDPTMLLDADVYRDLYKSEAGDIPKNPYLLFYYLDNGGSFDKESVYHFAREKNLEVQYVSGNSCVDSYKKNYAGVPEWLALVDNAEYVVTNSFHCCVFSILFGKRFGAVRLTGGNSGMNERLESLFETAACGERYVTDVDFSVLDASYRIDWNFEMKKRSVEILEGISAENKLLPKN